MTLGAWFLKQAERVGSARRRFFEMHGQEIVYYEKEQNGRGIGKKKGDIQLTAGMKVVAEGRELQLISPTRTWVLEADDAATSMQWQAAISTELKRLNKAVQNTPLSGWLVKAADGIGHARRRFFVVEGTWVKYYDSENVAEASLKGRFEITALTHIDQKEREILVINPGRTWSLTADDTIAAARWASILGDLQASVEGLGGPIAGNSDRDSSEANEDDVKDASTALDRFVMPGRGVWMWKDGVGVVSNLRGPRRRYFTLMYGSDVRMMKFVYFSKVLDQRPLNVKGYIPITRKTAVEATNGLLVVVRLKRA